MVYELPDDADDETTELVERTHELLLNELGYDADDVLVKPRWGAYRGADVILD